MLSCDELVFCELSLEAHHGGFTHGTLHQPGNLPVLDHPKPQPQVQVLGAIARLYLQAQRLARQLRLHAQRPQKPGADAFSPALFFQDDIDEIVFLLRAIDQ